MGDKAAGLLLNASSKKFDWGRACISLFMVLSTELRIPSSQVIPGMNVRASIHSVAMYNQMIDICFLPHT